MGGAGRNLRSPSKPMNPERPLDWQPIPDPTALTTQAVDRAVADLKELVNLQLQLVRDEQKSNFFQVSCRLDDVEHLRKEQKADTKVAVDYALAAQKELVEKLSIANDKANLKSESNFSEQLNQITRNFTTSLAALSTAISDLKERVSKVENVDAGERRQKKEVISNTTLLISFIGLVLVAVSIVVTVIIDLRPR